MSGPISSTEPIAEFDPSTLIVDQEYVDLVTARLAQEQGVRWSGAADVSARLGLVRLSGIEIAENYPEIAMAAHQEKLQLDLPSYDDWKEFLLPLAMPADLDHRYYLFDMLLAVLRARLAHEFGNWTPPLGKGRMSVVGTPQSKAGEDPIPADRPRRRTQGLGSGVRVAMLDTPIAAHPDLPDTLVSASTMYTGTGDHPKRAGHGTFVAGVIRAEASAARIRAVGVLDSVVGRATAWDVARAMVELADAGYDIVNLSLGSRTLDGEMPLLFVRALERLGPDTLVVASAGNRGSHHDAARTLPVWPAAQTDVVAVGASDSDLTPDLPWVDCNTRGELVSAYLTGKVRTSEPDRLKPFDGYARWGGSSFATAAVTGKIAARTVPGRVRAREAFEQLLDAPDSGVTKHVFE